MTITQLGADAPVSTGDDDKDGREETGEVLRLLGTGATGPILMALGREPLRTKELTRRVAGFAPRTIYRYAGKLTELGVVEREEMPGVPSKVVHRLTEPCGTELHALVAAFVDASLDRLPSGEVAAHSWGSLTMVADMWESGLVEELNLGPRTATELASGQRFLSYHQVSRRAAQLKSAGLIREWAGSGRRRRYELTEKARRAMALVAGVSRWRRRHQEAPGMREAGPGDAACLLRMTLPLLKLPQHTGKCLEVGVWKGYDEAEGTELVRAVIESDGTVFVSDGSGIADGWGRGRSDTWLDSLVDGDQGLLRLGGDDSLIEDCLAELHRTLWEAPAEV
jgi:DNA-binding HxlR family transcriptional regulator